MQIRPQKQFEITTKTHARVSDVGTDGCCKLPAATAAYASRLRREAVVVTHDELRFHLLHRVHRHADHDQQRCAAEVEVQSETVCSTGGKRVKEVTDER